MKEITLTPEHSGHTFLMKTLSNKSRMIPLNYVDTMIGKTDILRQCWLKYL